MENNVPTQVCSSSSLQSFSVIQFRGQEPVDHATDEYHKVLKDAGVGEVDRIPVLSFEFKNLPVLRQQLLEDESFTGMILTSPRAVEAVQKCLMGEECPTSPRVVEEIPTSRAVEAVQKCPTSRAVEEIPTSRAVEEIPTSRAVEECLRSEDILRWKEKWREKHIFCVGPKTGEEARQRLGVAAAVDPELIGDGRKLGVEIVSFLRKREELKGKLLLPCSTIAKKLCVEELESGGVEVVVSPVYETVSTPDAQGRLRKGVQETTGSVVYLVMFSPSNVNAVLPEVKRVMKERDVRIVAIGPTTKKAIEEAGVPVWSTSPSPSPLGLLRALHERLH